MLNIIEFEKKKASTPHSRIRSNAQKGEWQKDKRVHYLNFLRSTAFEENF